jgi:hypothetical protein
VRLREAFRAETATESIHRVPRHLERESFRPREQQRAHRAAERLVAFSQPGRPTRG